MRTGHRKIFAHKDWEVTQGWRKMHNTKFQDLYSSKNICFQVQFWTHTKQVSSFCSDAVENSLHLGHCSRYAAQHSKTVVVSSARVNSPMKNVKAGESRNIWRRWYH
jgi:hypothetical protein